MSREKIFRINLPTLFEQVNARRKEQGLPSVEPAVMAVRASIKFAITRQKHMDLKGDKVNLDEGDADALCQALGELFNVDMQIEEPAEEESSGATEGATTGTTPETPEVGLTGEIGGGITGEVGVTKSGKEAAGSDADGPRTDLPGQLSDPK